MSTPSWPQLLSILLSKQNLEREQASWAMRQIMNGEASQARLGAFMVALRAKGETVSELSGLVDVMLENSLVLETGDDAVDIVGTGGDLIGTVNISSMASIVASACGVPVLKHGSRSASGKTGASEMLEVLGVRLDLSPQQVSEIFKSIGITFFYAPVFHPAMKYVAPVRKELGIPTTFNFLGPLANPAQPIATALGVSDLGALPLMAEELANRGRTGLVFRGDDGMDEISTVTTNTVLEVSGGRVTEHRLDSESLGIKRAQIAQLIGGDARHNAEVALKLFRGEDFENKTAIFDMVALNAAAGLVAYDLAKNPTMFGSDFEFRMRQAHERASSSISQGSALSKLLSWTAASQQIASPEQ